jgi:hypothetical protein
MNKKLKMVWISLICFSVVWIFLGISRVFNKENFVWNAESKIMIMNSNRSCKSVVLVDVRLKKIEKKLFSICENICFDFGKKKIFLKGNFSAHVQEQEKEQDMLKEIISEYSLHYLDDYERTTGSFKNYNGLSWILFGLGDSKNNKNLSLKLESAISNLIKIKLPQPINHLIFSELDHIISPNDPKLRNSLSKISPFPPEGHISLIYFLSQPSCFPFALISLAH